MQYLKRTVSCLGRSEPPVYEATPIEDIAAKVDWH